MASLPVASNGLMSKSKKRRMRRRPKLQQALVVPEMEAKAMPNVDFTTLSRPLVALFWSYMFPDFLIPLVQQWIEDPLFDRHGTPIMMWGYNSARVFKMPVILSYNTHRTMSYPLEITRALVESGLHYLYPTEEPTEEQEKSQRVYFNRQMQAVFSPDPDADLRWAGVLCDMPSAWHICGSNIPRNHFLLVAAFDCWQKQSSKRLIALDKEEAKFRQMGDPDWQYRMLHEDVPEGKVHRERRKELRWLRCRHNDILEDAVPEAYVNCWEIGKQNGSEVLTIHHRERAHYELLHNMPSGHAIRHMDREELVQMLLKVRRSALFAERDATENAPERN
jgi:hypothetical protein